MRAMDQKKRLSAALTRPRRPLRTAGVAAAGVVVLAAASFGGVALAQTFTPNSAVEEVLATSAPESAPNEGPIASFSVLSIDGLTVTVDGSDSLDPEGSDLVYAWDFGDSGASSDPAPSHAYAGYGTYTITLTVTDDEGATDSFGVDVTLNAPPPPPPAPEPPANPGYTYGNYPPGAVMPNIPGTDQPDTSACASSSGTTNGSGGAVCA